MAQTADSVIVELLAKTEGFDGKMRQSATSFGGAMKQVETSAIKAEATAQRSLGQIRNQTRILGQQFADVGAQLSAGSSPFTVIAQQGPQIASALDGAGGAVGRFASFLSGPLGAAVLAATTILGGFLMKNRETADSVDDLVEKLKAKAAQDDLSARATELFSQSVEGVQKAAKDAAEAVRILENAQKSEIEVTVESIQKKLAQAKALRDTAIAQLEAAEANNANLGLAGADPRFQSQFKVAQSNIEALKKTIGSTSRAAASLEDSLNKALSFRSVERGGKSPVEKINERFDGLIEAARRRAVAEKKVGDQLERQVAALNKQRDAALKAESDRGRSSRSTGLRGNEVSASEAAAIARNAGLQVNSVNRSYAQQSALYNQWVAAGMPKDNPVAKPGTSAHEGANGRWALDIQFGKGVTPELLRKVFADQGVNLSKIIKERGHFHVEGSTAGADRAAGIAERAAEQEAARKDRQEGILGSLQTRYAEALARLAEGTEESADARKAAIEAERVAIDKKIDADDKLDANVKVEAKKLNDATAALTKELVDRAESERQFRLKQEQAQRDLTVAQALMQQEQGALQEMAGLARTQAERRDIELRILDLAIQEERLRAQAVIAARDALEAELAKTPVDKQTAAQKSALADANAQATIAQGTLDTLPGREDRGREQIMRDTAGPLQQLFDTMPQTAEEISQAFEQIAANGLSSLTDGITDAIMGAKSLGEAFRGVAQAIIRDIVQMIVKMLIFRALSAALGMPAGGGGGGSGGIGDFGLGASMISNMIGGGFNGGIGGGSSEKWATGGFIRGPGTATSDSILARLSNGEYVMKAAAVRKLGVPFLEALNGGRLPAFAAGGIAGVAPSNAKLGSARGLTVVQNFTLDARHGITTPELLRHVNTVAANTAKQAGEASYDASQKALPMRLGRISKLGSV